MHWDIFPNALILKGVQLHDSEHCDSGAFAIVYSGMHDGRRVALKKPRRRQIVAESGSSASRTRTFKVRLQLFDVGITVKHFATSLT